MDLNLPNFNKYRNLNPALYQKYKNIDTYITPKQNICNMCNIKCANYLRCRVFTLHGVYLCKECETKQNIPDGLFYCTKCTKICCLDCISNMYCICNICKMYNLSQCITCITCITHNKCIHKSSDTF